MVKLNKNGERFLRLTIDSSVDYIPLVCMIFREVVSYFTVEKNLLFQAEVSLTEALSNIIEHAYEKKPGNEIEVEIRVDSQAMEITISNVKGIPMSNDQMNASSVDQFDLNKITHNGGLGIYIIRSFMDVVDYRTNGDKNVLFMKKKLKMS